MPQTRDGRGHPECPERLDAINDHLLYTGLLDHLVQPEVPLVPISVVELAHSKRHVAALRGMNDALLEDIDAGGPKYAQIDPDTAMNPFTLLAALRATGAAVAATDAVMGVSWPMHFVPFVRLVTMPSTTALWAFA